MALVCLALVVAHMQHMPATRRALLQSLPAAAAVGAAGAHASRAAALSAAPLAVAAAPSAGSEFYSGQRGEVKRGGMAAAERATHSLPSRDQNGGC